MERLGTNVVCDSTIRKTFSGLGVLSFEHLRKQVVLFDGISLAFGDNLTHEKLSEEVKQMMISSQELTLVGEVRHKLPVRLILRVRARHHAL